jgi:hypothetical protein
MNSGRRSFKLKLPYNGDGSDKWLLKSFCWFLLNDRLNTKDMLQWKSFKIDDNGNCTLCEMALVKLENTFSGAVSLANTVGDRSASD